MITFIAKGILRDRTRSLFPILTVIGGVCLTVIFQTWMTGAMGSLFDTMAKVNTGHVKIMTRGFQQLEDQKPMDLALLNTPSLLKTLAQFQPDYYWLQRTPFGGLIDFPDENGETRIQGPVFGIALNLLDPASPEHQMFKLKKALVNGRLPQRPGDILMSQDYADKLGVKAGDRATLISATAEGGMAIYNFNLVGTVHFGVMTLDRSAILADITDIQQALNLIDGATEIIGLKKTGVFSDEETVAMSQAFNDRYSHTEDTFSPIMIPFRNQSGLGSYLTVTDYMLFILTVIFVSVMSIVLWNSGLMNSIRRYGEFGLRLAIGESKGALYLSLIGESVVVGIIGSVIGTTLGLLFSYWLSTVGIDISSSMKGASYAIETIMKPAINTQSFIVGFLPGLIAPVIGAMIAGITIFRRQTASLFKELES